jgi:hypothetical protein
VLERDLQRPDGARHSMRRIFLKDLIVVLGLGRVSLQEHVRVDVDQTGQERAVPEVENARSRRRRRADALDPPVAHDDDGRGDVAAGAYVEHPARADGDRHGLLSGRGESGEPGGEPAGGELFHGVLLAAGF